MKVKPIHHGTYGGYQQHLKRGVQPCEECREARNTYVRSYRENPARRARERTLEAARTRALARLARAHSAEYRRLYEEEKNR